MRKRLGRRLATFIVSISWPVLAQTADANPAEELFKEGRAALARKDYALACAKLADSNHLEPAVGTLISLGQCNEAQNKLVVARQHYFEAAELADAKHDPLQRERVAREKLAELDKRIAHLTVEAGKDAPANVVVKQDDIALPFSAFGSAQAVDPGKHILVVSAEGRAPSTIEVSLAEGESRVVTADPGAPLVVLAPAPAPPTPAPPPAVEARGSVPAEDSSDPTMRLVGLTLGGVGVVGAGLGTVFGLRASSKWASAQEACKPGACAAGSAAQTDKDEARSAATISTITFAAAGLALGAGIVVYLMAPSSSGTAVALRPSLGGLAAIGEF
jgi:hypothetical protein